jgi:hypothetical protein
MILSIERRATSARRTLCETLDTQFGGFSAGSPKKGRTRVRSGQWPRGAIVWVFAGLEQSVCTCPSCTRHVIQDSQIVT